MTETLDQRRRLVALLARQLLFERAELPIGEAVERLGGLQTQDVATFLVDGQVAGLWRYRDGRIEVEPIARVPPRARREIDEEAARLAAFH